MDWSLSFLREMSSTQCNSLQGFVINYKVLEQKIYLSFTWNLATLLPMAVLASVVAVSSPSALENKFDGGPSRQRASGKDRSAWW